MSPGIPGGRPPGPPSASRWVCLICPWVNESGDRCAQCGSPRPRPGASLRTRWIEPRPSPPPTRPAKVATPLAVIVARDKPWLHTRFHLKFRNTTARVLFDRRVGERRHQSSQGAPERRRADRRARPTVEADIQAQGWAIVRTS